MDIGAKTRGKYTPGVDYLVIMLEENRLCPTCGKIMMWIPNADRKGDTATLQHYSDGSIGIMCHSCNTSDGLLGAPLRGAVKMREEGVILSVAD